MLFLVFDSVEGFFFVDDFYLFFFCGFFSFKKKFFNFDKMLGKWLI